MFSPPSSEADVAAMGVELSRLLQRDVARVERIGGGRNSQVYRVATGDGVHFALKAYFRHANDKRDRLATEFGAFSFLWRHGIREIPQPIAADPRLGWAVYQFIAGEKIPAGAAGVPEVTAAAEFLGRLRGLTRAEGSRGLECASEAFFSVSEIIANIQARLDRLRSVEGTTGTARALHEFLSGEFAPCLAEAVAWSSQHLRANGMSLSGTLDWTERTLSPSDFGFHNALRQRDRIIFLDFEYFGWDDAGKMISDFLWHPAMDLPKDAKKQFVAVLRRHFSDWPGLAARLEGVYPLFGLKWCLILLNEFLPDQMLRRQFAAVSATDHATLQAQQLAKARGLLFRIRSEYQNFPYL